MKTLREWQIISLGIALFGIALVMSSTTAARPALAMTFESPAELPASAGALRPRVYLPLVARPIMSCAPTGEAYGALEPIDPATGDMAQHPDVNLAIRGYVATTAYLGLVDYAGDIDQNNTPPEIFVLRRAAAYQAYYETMPLRATAMPAGSHMRIFRRLRFGRLIDLSVLDTRQWRSDQPCGDGIRDTYRVDSLPQALNSLTLPDKDGVFAQRLFQATCSGAEFQIDCSRRRLILGLWI